MSDSRKKHIVRSFYIGSHRFHRKKLTRRDLLQRRCSENIVNSVHCKVDSFTLTDISDIEFHFSSHLWSLSLKMMAHIILFLFITRQDTDFSDITV